MTPPRPSPPVCTVINRGKGQTQNAGGPLVSPHTGSRQGRVGAEGAHGPQKGWGNGGRTELSEVGHEVTSLIPERDPGASASPDSDIKPWCPLPHTHSGGRAMPATPRTPQAQPQHPHSITTTLLDITSPGPSVPRRGQPVPPAPAAPLSPSPSRSGVPQTGGSGGVRACPATPRPARRQNTRRYQHDCTAHTTTPRSRTTTTAWRGAVPTQRGGGVGAQGGHGTQGHFPPAAGAAPPAR